MAKSESRQVHMAFCGERQVNKKVIKSCDKLMNKLPKFVYGYLKGL